ncbi:kelch-like protein 32 isoform X4 [Artibeus jamaicensis]|uniref:kelch-like protein 32 isoform X4 n=1 Tax=Artibeus jamaicensis TaxID=9417 RepID=UPI00235AB25C|nr:kelch-like protein 32 isoform X4 [Artibeus jamaicensis]
MPSERCLSIQEMLTGQRLCHSESHHDSVLAALNQQRSDGILCDVTLIAEEQKFHAHKAVLAACSDYFRAMFSLCMVESGADEVNLHGVTSLGLKQALEFAYTGQILLEPGVIQDVLAAGSHLQLLELLNLCSHYLIQELNSFNYLDLYRLADLFNLTLLEKAVIDFLVKHLSELLKSRPEDVLTLPYCLLQEVLKSDRLTSLSEEQIWQLAVRWLEHNCHYQHMDELLQYIRFGLMDVDTLHTVALSHPLVQASEAATALVNEALEYHQSLYAQPVWQTRRTKPRFQSDTLYIIGGKKREVCKVKELRYFNPVDQENALIAAIANWSGVTNTAQYQNRLMVYEPNQNKWISRSPMLQRRVYHSMAAVHRKLYVLGGNDLDYNNDRILVRHIDSYNIDTDQWTRCSFNLLTGQNESGVAVHNERIYLVGGYSIWTNEPLACIQVLDVSREGKEEVFYGPTLPFASNGIAACFLPAPYFTCPNLQTLQVPHHRIGTV